MEFGVRATFCNARCGMLCLIHPKVAVVWNKVDIEYVRHDVILRCRAMSGVKCGVAMWNEGVVHGECGGVL